MTSRGWQRHLPSGSSVTAPQGSDGWREGERDKGQLTFPSLIPLPGAQSHCSDQSTVQVRKIKPTHRSPLETVLSGDPREHRAVSEEHAGWLGAPRSSVTLEGSSSGDPGSEQTFSSGQMVLGPETLQSVRRY